MVLPFILAGAALAAGGFGIGKGFMAVGPVNQAKELEEQAQARFEVRKASVEKARESCQAALVRLVRMGDALGYSLPWRSMAEFNDFMEDENQPFVL